MGPSGDLALVFLLEEGEGVVALNIGEQRNCCCAHPLSSPRHDTNVIPTAAVHFFLLMGTERTIKHGKVAWIADSFTKLDQPSALSSN